jgi:hypothetical protein
LRLLLRAGRGFCRKVERWRTRPRVWRKMKQRLKTSPLPIESRVPRLCAGDASTVAAAVGRRLYRCSTSGVCGYRRCFTLILVLLALQRFEKLNDCIAENSRSVMLTPLFHMFRTGQVWLCALHISQNPRQSLSVFPE